VLAHLSGQIDLVLDAGPTPGGIESTVLDLTTHPPRVLRPGPIEASQLAAVVGGAIETGGVRGTLNGTGADAARSPGMHARHYAPRASLECVAREELPRRVRERSKAGLRIGVLSLDVGREISQGVMVVQMPLDATTYGARLYAELHALDEKVTHIIVQLPPQTPEWAAIHDRLRKASHSA
jgi:L-threonylcarbamoyladenylate synthase